MSRMRRGLTFEQIEQRIVLSGSTGVGEGTVVDGDVSSQAYVASDDVSKAANNLGVIDGRAAFNDYVGRFDERDLFRFALEDDAEVDISLDRGGSDAEIFLLDENRFSIRDTKPTWQKGDLTTALAAGEYLVKVQRKGVTDANYTLNVIATMAPSGPPADIAGNTFDDALDLGILTASQTFHDFVGASDSADAFQFNVATTSELGISMTGLTGDADIYLFDGDRQRVGQSQTNGLNDEFLSVTIPAGTYTAAVAPHLKADSHYSITFAADGSLVAPIPGGVTPLPDVPDFGSPATDWNLNLVNAPEAWAAGHTGAGVTVAIVDTGIQLDHIDLHSNIWFNPGEIAGDNIDNDGNGYVDDVNGWDFISNDNDPTDDDGHGTHVAGTVAALNDSAGATGVAYDAQLMAVKALDDTGGGTWLSVSAGIRYAVDNGADVINLSLGGPAGSNAILSALQYAQQHDVVVVAASGNESALVPGYPAYYAANLPNVLSVGAYDENLHLAGFSNKVGNSGAVQVDGPGVDVYSTMMGSGFGELSGTSMATPHAAGVAALVLSAYPGLTSIQTRNALTVGVSQTVVGSDSIGALNAALAIPVGPTVPATALNGVNPGLRPPSDGTVTADSTSLRSTQTVSPKLAALDQVFAMLAGSDS